MNCPKCRFDNPSDSKFCKECGTRLLPAKEIPPLPTETLRLPVQELEPGSTFAGRYQIIEELGSGGMGRVYKAFDTKVNEKVALKLIRPDIASDRETIERFGNELRLARRIRHKNVCGMFDLGEADGAHFLTMEYVHGEDLKSMIRMSAGLTTATVLGIAKQVCDGLSEAHALGIVHRDLKPGNIMIDKGGNAKIMDFGIARSLKEKRLTGPSVLIGTPEYMSPEQAEEKEIDQRSDIYSLGVILYEMATGKVPFEGDSALGIAMKHKGEVPRNPGELNPSIPDGLGLLILKCLEKDPSQRFQTAAEMRAEVERIESAIPTTARIVPGSKPATSKEITLKFTRKRFFLNVLAVLAVLLAAFLVWRLVLKKPLAVIAGPKRSIAIISFENQTGKPEYDYLSKVIPNLLITKLEQSGFFDVTTWERMRDLLKQAGKDDIDFIDPDTGFEVCRKEGVEHIVLGMLSMSGNTFVTDAKVMDVADKKLLGTASARGDGPDSVLRNQVDDLSRQIARGGGLSERQASAAGKRIGDLTTNSLEAYNLYLQGREEDQKLRSPQARQYYEKAVALDPNFAMVLRALGGDSLKKAVALSKNVTEKERLYIEASYAIGFEDDRQKAIALYRQIVKKYPKEKEAYYLLGDHAADIEEALAMFSRALELDPNFGSALNAMGYTFLILNKPEEAVESFKRYAGARPGDANALDSLADAYFQMGRFDQALQSYQTALAIDPDYTGSYLGMAYIAWLREDYAATAECLEKEMGHSLAEDKICAYAWKGFLLFWLGRMKESLNYVQMAEDLAAAPDFMISRGRAQNVKAWIRYGQMDFESSRRLNLSSLKLLEEGGSAWRSFSKTGFAFLEGLLDLREGKAEAARAGLAEMESIARTVPRRMSWSSREKDIAEVETEWLRGEILLHEGSFDKAATSLRASVSPEFTPNWTAPDYHKIRYNAPFLRDVLARAYVERGDIDKAIVEYERLTTLDLSRPARLLIHPLYHYRLGMLYERKGDKAKAISCYERFLNLWKDADPGTPEVADAGKRLESLKQ
jgi:serine/threonine protein kinase/tetratricopeptide (TPR) repeat protein